MLKWERFFKKGGGGWANKRLCIKVARGGSNIVCHLILEVVSTQCGEWEWAAKLMDGWRGCLISRLPQVISHCMCFLVKISTMDRLLSHDYNQYWSTQGKKEKWTKLKSLPPTGWWGEQRWHSILPLFIAIKSFQDIWLLAGEILTAIFLFSSFCPSILSKWAWKH